MKLFDCVWYFILLAAVSSFWGCTKDPGDTMNGEKGHPRGIYAGHLNSGDNTGVGALISDGGYYVCTAFEIADRCILTNAHCIYRHSGHVYTQLAQVQSGGYVAQGIMPMKTSTHPKYVEYVNKPSPFPNIKMAVDLGLMWMERERDFAPTRINWNPKKITSSALPSGNVQIYGYGEATNTAGQIHYRKSGEMNVTTEMRGDWFVGSWWVALPIATDYHYSQAGDSGGPLMRDDLVYGVLASLRALNSTELWATTFHDGNYDYVSLSGNGFARKFCRPLTSANADVYPENSGTVTGETIDSLIPANEEAINCPPKCTSTKGLTEKVHLEATPTYNYQFKGWTSINPYTCPCQNSTSTICDYTAAGLTWTQEKYGVKCIAYFESSPSLSSSTSDNNSESSSDSSSSALTSSSALESSSDSMSSTLISNSSWESSSKGPESASSDSSFR